MADFKESLRLPPAPAVTRPAAAAPATPADNPIPAKPKAPGPRNAASATVAMIRPTELCRTLLTALPMLLNALPISRKRLKYSGRPVAGLMVPAPPCCFKRSASFGEMCANMESPKRPCAAIDWAALAIPPRANCCCGGIGAWAMGTGPPPLRERLVSINRLNATAKNSGSYLSGRSPASNWPLEIKSLMAFS